MEHLGLSYMKLTYTLAAADPENQREYRNDILIKKRWLNNEIAHLLI